VDEALEVIERVKPKKAYLTHMSHEMDYDRLNPTLPSGVEMAYDGLTLTY
jgi:phosphoribosyl 1,2-cyclic phosphate phosphodiesterase